MRTLFKFVIGALVAVAVIVIAVPLFAAEPAAACEAPWIVAREKLLAAGVTVIEVNEPEMVKTVIANLPFSEESRKSAADTVGQLFVLRKGEQADIVFVDKNGCVLGETGSIPDPDTELKRLFTPGAPAWHNPKAGRDI